MIVKVRTVDEGWLFVKANSVKARTLTKEQYTFGMEIFSPTYKHIDPKNEYDSKGKCKVKVINIDNSKELIYTNMPSYLLNNDGKTVEML